MVSWWWKCSDSQWWYSYFELCFTVLGAVGESVCVTLGQGVPATLWGSTTVSELPICYEYGQVNIISDDVTTMVQVGTNSKPKVRLFVLTLKDLQMSLLQMRHLFWNPAELKYVSTGAYNQRDWKFSDFNWSQIMAFPIASSIFYGNPLWILWIKMMEMSSSRYVFNF